ncbi:putative 40S ribosomal protein S16-like [Capsicum annuum]|uniref:wax ester synthase/diacylglycerol acyltransferase 11 isoform X2 n=1 Tax=Capsicum annuum TaxID=4072 RepID=UPI0007BF1908|nr:wax ester synthase/diacylglycerol acyltransferase 11 isoform X2 [Capsicum annuum]KAF3615687.1 putative 40S ribosomal protein S16-like [Capsicum annuum]KAF3615936.1 putative 40S ribosomal protein S16-like [Capsicum annuum]
MTDVDEPLTPAGRLFIQPEMDQVINCAVSVDDSIDVDAVKLEISNSILVKHPRFSSIMVKDSCGRERWRKVEVNVDEHFIIRRESQITDDPSISDEDAVNDYLADLSVSTPLSLSKPLWEFHLLLAHKYAVLRLHHSLGDGISLMSMFLSCCRRADDPNQRPTTHGIGASSSSNDRKIWSLLTKLLKVIWYTLVYVIEFALRTLWLKDKRTAISGGAGVELWPRKLATAKFKIDDMKTVKKVIPNATINDVLFGIISCGLSRYLDLRSPKALKEGLQLTGAAMINLRKQSGLQDFSQLMDSKKGARWGNKFGMLLLPIYYHKGGSDPLQFVKRSKAMIDKKKLSLEGPCSYKIGNFVMSFFGPKLAGVLNYRILSNTTFTISNVIGPQEDITFGGNHISSVRVTSSSLPHAITMHMVSYAGKADMQISVAKDIIPDPKVLAKCFQDALLEMKEAATTIAKS